MSTLKILILYQGKIPQAPDQVRCFSDVWSHYLTDELKKHVELDLKSIPGNLGDADLKLWFNDIDVSCYDAVIALGLRYFSTVPREIGETLRQRLYPNGLLCQLHDGSRLDNDPVDITFTPKDETEKYYIGSDANRFVRHHTYNQYVGWAADPDLNHPDQDPTDLRILVDHTNYGDNAIDRTAEILQQIKVLRDSGMWQHSYQSISVRRFDSGCVVDVDLDDDRPLKKYDRKTIPFTEICQEHSKAHVFCVTHPESVGLVVLETAMAGALVLSPKGFIPVDRLKTVRHIEWEEKINWQQVLKSVNPESSRSVAIKNSWESVAKRMRDVITIYQRIRKGQ